MEKLELMVEKIEELGHSLTAVGEETLAHVYPLAVRQAYVRGIASLILIVAFPLLVVGWMKYCILAVENNLISEDGCEVNATDFVLVFGMVLLIIIGIMALFLTPALLELFNPEWYAIQHIISLIGGS